MVKKCRQWKNSDWKETATAPYIWEFSANTCHLKLPDTNSGSRLIWSRRSERTLEEEASRFPKLSTFFSFFSNLNFLKRQKMSFSFLRNMELGASSLCYKKYHKCNFMQLNFYIFLLLTCNILLEPFEFLRQNIRPMAARQSSIPLTIPSCRTVSTYIQTIGFSRVPVHENPPPPSP